MTRNWPQQAGGEGEERSTDGDYGRQIEALTTI